MRPSQVVLGCLLIFFCAFSSGVDITISGLVEMTEQAEKKIILIGSFDANTDCYFFPNNSAQSHAELVQFNNSNPSLNLRKTDLYDNSVCVCGLGESSEPGTYYVYVSNTHAIAVADETVIISIIPDHVNLLNDVEFILTGDGKFDSPPSFQVVNAANISLKDSDATMYVNVEADQPTDGSTVSTQCLPSPKNDRVTIDPVDFSFSFDELEITGCQGVTYTFVFYYEFDSSEEQEESLNVNYTIASVGVKTCEAIRPNSVASEKGSCVCNAGFYRVLEECVKCSIGYYKSTTGDAECTSCAKRKTTEAAGANDISSCVCKESFFEIEGECFCPPGYEFSPDEVLCTECGAGRYSTQNTMADSCKSCGANYITVDAETGLALENATSVDCCQCSSTFIEYSTSTSTQCICDVGYYEDTAGSSCVACPENTYKESVLSESCTDCNLESEYTISTASSSHYDCLCKEGWYRVDKDSECLECPSGATCLGDAALPFAQAGYFQSREEDYVFLECANADACTGHSICATGYQGIICGDCADDYYRMDVDCISCDGGASAILPLCLIFLFLVMILFYFSSYRPESATTFGALRTCFNFLQVTALFAEFRVNWPTAVRDVFRALTVVNLSFEITAPECSMGHQIDFYEAFVYKFFTPFMVVAIISIIYGCVILHGWIVQKLIARGTMTTPPGSSRGLSFVRRCIVAVQSPLTDDRKFYARLAYFRVLFIYSMMTYLPTSVSVLEFFGCTSQPDGEYLLDAFPGTKCYTSTYFSYLPLAIFGIVLYVLSVPALVYAILHKNKASLTSEKTYLMFGFLYARYNARHYMWELIILVRKLLLVVSFVFLNSHIELQVLLAAIVLLGSVMYHNNQNPFRVSMLNTLETICLSTNFIILIVGNVFYAELSSDFLRTILVVLIITILVGILVLILVVFRYEIRMSKKESMSKQARERAMDDMDDLAAL
eukprot:GCRY01002412.1.p1 GENE.GCRY01002412.1~~GCRY01002412.1.p1  ORF type:complete len:954 (-),score=245.34 GCRY01002412.1:790-3651(-)